ncbi:xylulokinase [Edaphobacter sp. 12200R-103]|uniref:xylulokinase n=1 Tax=Edaphobacter sp. 12200R-103 TaxID=2703788 RepID=UPI00138DC0B9|nr:xylulokinase [Edaphobacter sp. 12200R-103]QHS50722.1 xylulokinase [Edaphobacter sp. 12200R-103]
MFLGIDCGTQGTKALLIGEDGKPLGRGYAPHALIERETGAREQEPQWWIDALLQAVRQALAQAPDAKVHALGVSGQQHGLVVLDESRQVIRPAKLWNDTETAPQNAELVERLGGTAGCLQKIGIVPLTGYTASKLLWLRENEPENLARIRHILLPHDYLNFWLTGQFAAEYGDASGTAFFDVRTRQWSREVLDAIDGGSGLLWNALPRLHKAEEIIGALRPEAAAELGISPDCVVSTGGGDNMMGAIGTGNVKQGIVTMSLGTSSTVYSFCDYPISDPTGSVAPFCSSSGAWLPLVCTMNATNVVTQTLNLFGKTVEAIDPALSGTKPGADGLSFLPFLNGERTPDLPRARGSIGGISSNNYTPDNLIRAVIEGVSFGIIRGLDLIMDGRKPEVIFAIGGGARSTQWRQLLADATGAVIQVPMEEEAGCLGAAMQAMYAFRHSSGSSETMAAIAKHCVAISPDKKQSPRPGLFEPYREAMDKYQRLLNELYLQKSC